MFQNNFACNPQQRFHDAPTRNEANLEMKFLAQWCCSTCKENMWCTCRKATCPGKLGRGGHVPLAAAASDPPTRSEAHAGNKNFSGVVTLQRKQNHTESRRPHGADFAPCASLRSRHAHGHRTRDVLCKNLQEKRCAPSSEQPSRADLVRACTGEMHTDILL